MGLPRAPFKFFFFFFLKAAEETPGSLQSLFPSKRVRLSSFPPPPELLLPALYQTEAGTSDLLVCSAVGGSWHHKIKPDGMTEKKKRKKERESQNGISQFLAMQNQSNPPCQGCRNAKPQDTQP